MNLKLKFITGFIAMGALMMSIASSAQAYVFQEPNSKAKGLAHFMMAKIHEMNGEHLDAVDEYKKAIEFDQRNYALHLHLGTAYARLDQLDKSIEELNLVKLYNPEDLQSHYLLALIYTAQKDYDKATQEYEIILKSFSKLEPENVEIYGYLGQLYYSQKKYDQAIGQFNKILEIEPKNADVRYLLGSIYFEVGQKDKALSEFKQSIDVDPNHDGSLNSLAYLYASENANLDEALSLINRALEIDPQNAAYLDSLGWIYYRKEMYKEALETLTKADSILKDPVIYDHLGDVYYKLEQTDNAMKYWELSLQLLPEQQEVLQKIHMIKSNQASR